VEEEKNKGGSTSEEGEEGDEGGVTSVAALKGPSWRKRKNWQYQSGPKTFSEKKEKTQEKKKLERLPGNPSRSRGEKL